jgi:hypothetical protein
MISVDAIVLTAIIIGLVISATVGRACRGDSPLMLFVFIFAAIFIGGAFSFGAGLLHSVCGRFCVPTTDTTVFHFALPLIAAPINWLVMTVGMFLGAPVEQAKRRRPAANMRAVATANPPGSQGAPLSSPLGRCPNCCATLPVQAEVCPSCKAVFGHGAAWEVEPL